MESHIQQLFRYIDTEKRFPTSQPVSQAYDEYNRLVQLLLPGQRDQFTHVLRVIHCCEKDQLISARAQLQAARKEYQQIQQIIATVKTHDASFGQRQPETHAFADRQRPGAHAAYPGQGQGQGYNQARGGGRQDRDTDDRINRTIESDTRNRDAGYRLQQNNPHITDLSDMKRPMKIAEKYSELYDNEWTDAYDELYKQGKGEISIISDLLAIIRNAYHWCKEESELQLRILEDAVVCVLSHGTLDNLKQHKHDASQVRAKDRSYLVQYRKAGAALAISRLQQTFKKVALKSSDKAAVRNYAAKCVEVCWWAVVQDPPIEMYDEEGGQFDMNMFKAYTERGATVAFLVWPALLLQAHGPVLARGVAQGK